MTIYFQRFLQGPAGNKGFPHAIQTLQRLPQGALLIEKTELLGFIMDGSYRLSVKGGLSATYLRGNQEVQIAATPRSYGGQLHFHSLKAGEPDVKVDVYMESQVPAYSLKIHGFGVRDYGRVFLARVIGHEQPELDSQGLLPALESEVTLPRHVAPFADFGWIIVLSAGPVPKLLKILKDTWD